MPTIAGQAGLSSFNASSASPAGGKHADYYIKIDTIKGEATADKHAGEIEVLSFSFGVGNPSSPIGGGLGSGKASFQDLHFTTVASVASPLLMKACATGQHIKSAKLTGRKAGTEQQDYYTITLSDCIISSFQQGGGEFDARPHEQVSINFAKIEFEYKPQKMDGSLDSPVKSGYDLKTSKAS